TGNIGLLLGTPSGGLVDIDLDCVEAVELAPQFLPPTVTVTGRPSRPRSHWWYVCPDAITVKHKDPVSGAMIVELRSTGSQTVVGPSTHPDDEPYDRLIGDPAVVDTETLADAVAALAEAVVRQRHGDLPSRASRAHHPPSSVSPDQRVRRATAYVNAMPESISGLNGHDRAYAAATAVVHGFDLDADTGFSILWEHFNARCDPPWSEKELRHKVEDAAGKPHDMPRGWLLNAQREPAHRSPPMSFTGPGVPEPLSTEHPDPGHLPKELLRVRGDDDIGIVPLGEHDPATGRLILSPRRTLPTAEAYVRAFYDHPDGPMLHHFAGMLMAWRDGRFVEIEEAAVRNQLQKWLHNSLKYVVDRRTGDMLLTDFEANPGTVRQALETICNHTFLPATTPTPTWLSGDSLPPPEEMLPCKTTILHLPTGRVIPATPRFFSVNALDYDPVPTATRPDKWFRFLDQVFGDDEASVQLLQEWMGYCLVSDTSQQKMLLIVGPRRSGKGTIGRVIAKLIGQGNVCGPTTSGLASNFGLQPLIGKSLAVVSDARFSGDNIQTVVERLLCISGEDALTIDRKHKTPVTMKLAARFMFMSNELPRFGDASNALTGRFLILQMTESFYGREDRGLTERLLEDIPGILNWAIEGWKRLRERGHFVQPTAAEDAIRELEDLSSPVGAFVRDRCEMVPGARSYVDDLYAAYKAYIEGEGWHTPSTKPVFGRDLQAAVPGLRRRRNKTLGYFYEGLSLKGGI
ncbi:MAG: bifunctional DNA primase/polymerase, partial [Phycisphaerales bacterium]|nr:bifunctional DNA primase/polymerase [Phycisphaerales bacterium]